MRKLLLISVVLVVAPTLAGLTRIKFFRSRQVPPIRIGQALAYSVFADVTSFFVASLITMTIANRGH